MSSQGGEVPHSCSDKEKLREDDASEDRDSESELPRTWFSSLSKISCFVFSLKKDSMYSKSAHRDEGKSHEALEVLSLQLSFSRVYLFGSLTSLGGDNGEVNAADVAEGEVAE
eukprot:10929443-Heterocapsa_arctica.AAC.1